MDQAERKKIIVFWSLVGFFACIVFILWFFNFNNFIKTRKQENLVENEELIQIKDEIIEVISNMKEGVKDGAKESVGIIEEEIEQIKKEDEAGDLIEALP